MMLRLCCIDRCAYSRFVVGIEFAGPTHVRDTETLRQFVYILTILYVPWTFPARHKPVLALVEL